MMEDVGVGGEVGAWQPVGLELLGLTSLCFFFSFFSFLLSFNLQCLPGIYIQG